MTKSAKNSLAGKHCIDRKKASYRNDSETCMIARDRLVCGRENENKDKHSHSLAPIDFSFGVICLVQPSQAEVP